MHDEKLILYYYDDGLSDEERQQVASALEQDTALAERYVELRQRLSELAEVRDGAAPKDLVHRLHDSIDRAARTERRKLDRPVNPFHFMSFFWGAAITAALALGIGIGVYLSGSDTTTPVFDDTIAATATRPAAPIPAAFARGLQVHLRASQRDISQLPMDSAADRALLIMGIIEQNRLFEHAAEQKNAPKLARVLRAFEPILVRLAAEDLAPEDVEALRAQLAFELNVMLTKLTHETSTKATSI